MIASHGTGFKDANQFMLILNRIAICPFEHNVLMLGNWGLGIAGSTRDTRTDYVRRGFAGYLAGFDERQL